MPAAKKATEAAPAAPIDPDRDPRWAALAAPFPADQIEKLPKQVSRNDQDKARCERGTRASADGHFCGGWHARSVHLDYVGHAGITMRLNDVVGPEGWSWEPMATTPEGLPLMGRQFWIKLTILGVSKYEVADNFNSVQEGVGDALRRAAMRFGVGTYLWSKSEHAHNLATAADDTPAPAPARQAPPSQASGGQRQQGPAQQQRQQPPAGPPENHAPAEGDPYGGTHPTDAPADHGNPSVGAPDVVAKAHVIAAVKCQNVHALKDVWDRAQNDGTLATVIPDPDADDKETTCTVGEFITRRKAQIEQADAA